MVDFTGFFDDVEKDPNVKPQEAVPTAPAAPAAEAAPEPPAAAPAEAAPVTPPSNPETPASAYAGFFDDVEKAPADDSFLGGVTRAAQNVVHAAIDPIASVPASLELATRNAQKLTGVEGEAKIEDTLGFKTTQFLRGLANLVGEADPNDTSMVQQVASGAGSVVGIGVPALLAGMFGTPVAGLATGAGLGSAQMSVQMFEEARAKGADEDTALLYGGVGGIIGLSDILPIGRALKLLPAPLRRDITSKFLKKSLEIVSGAGEEAAQEYGQQVAQNLAANGILNEDRAWDQDALQGAIVGSIVGGGVGLAGSFVPDRKPATGGGVETVTESGPSTEEAAALTLGVDPSTPAAAPTEAPAATAATAAPVAEDVAAALETPAAKARRAIETSRKRSTAIEDETAATAVTPEVTAAIAPEAPAAPDDQGFVDGHLDADAEVPGADTILPEPPVEAAAPAPVAPVAEEPVAPAEPVAAPEETVPTVPESPETIEIQRADLQARKRKAVLYPFGTVVPAEIEGKGFTRVSLPKIGVVDFDNRQVNRGVVMWAARNGKLNELLDLGPSNKADVAQSVAAGSPEVAVTERTPDGVEVKAAAGSEELAPAQVSALEETKSAPENTVQVEAPQEVIAARTAEPVTPVVTEAPKAPKAEKAKKVSEERSGPRFIPDLRTEAREIENQQKEWNAEIRERARAANKGVKETAGKNWKVEQREDRARNNEDASAIVEAFAPIGTTEDAYLGRNTAAINSRAVIKARAAAMVAAAEKAGVKIPERDKGSKDESMQHNAAVITLMEARSLARKEAPGRDDFDRFMTRDIMLRSGKKEDLDQVREERRAEGDQKKSTSGAKSTDNIAAPAAEVTSEVTEDEPISLTDLAPTTGDEDVQTKAGKSSRMGVRGLSTSSETRTVKTKSGKEEEVEVAKAASGEKLDADTKAKLIAEMNALIARAQKSRSWRSEVHSLAGDIQSAHSMTNAVELAAAQKGLSDGEVLRMGLVQTLSLMGTDVKALGDKMLRKTDMLSGGVYAKWQKNMAPFLLRRISQTIPEVPVFALDDYHMDLIGGAGAGAFYDPATDLIALRQSTFEKPDELYHFFIHEAAHAMFFHRLKTDRALRKNMEALLDHVRADFGLAAGEYGDVYGLMNVDEFLSEAWSNSWFQERLSNISVPKSLWGDLPKPTDPILRNALNWIKNQIHRMFGTLPIAKGQNAFDVAMQVGGAILETSPDTRVSYYLQLDYDDATGEALSPIQRIERDASLAPSDTRDKLARAGLTDAEADEVDALIRDEFGGKVTDEEIAAIAAEFAKPVTSDSDLKAKVAVTPPPGKPAVAALTSGEDFSKKTKVRAWFLKVMTLDFLRQKYGKLFVGADGTRHLDQFVKALQERDAIVSRVAKDHNLDAAQYIDYSKRNPAAAKDLAELAMDATRYDVNLGAGADNSHLGVAAKRGLQAKKRLADLQARYDGLPPEAKKLFDQMTVNYRKSHNAAKRQLASNVLDMLDTKLSPADHALMVDKVVNGTLIETDAAILGSPTIFRALKNAAALKAIRGAYFPQMRFGDHVVVTSEKIDTPPLKSIMVGGKAVPVTTEVTKNTVRFTADNSIRGVAAELDRQVSNYIANHDLKSLRSSIRWKDRATGDIVTKGEQIVGHDYDMTYEVELQTKGVHYFDNKRDAEKFSKEEIARLGKDNASEVLERRSDRATNMALDGTDVGAIVKRIDARTDLSAGDRSAMKKALEEAVVASMPGNRSPARYQARRNVLGASKDIGRAAAVYGTAQGHFMASLETAPKTREQMRSLGEIERKVFAENAGAVSQVMNELRRRVDGIDNPNEPNAVMQTIAQLSFFDKLASPAASVVNAMQVSMNTLPWLGGRYGNFKASAAIASAYTRMGVVGTIGRGIGHSVESIAKWRAAAIDTSDIIGSVRKKLGPKYEDLLNELISRGALDENAGMELAAAVIEGKGMLGTNLARFDRAVRQLPGAVEVVNRTVAGVATYDLARAAGKDHDAAVQEAFDTIQNTQFDYRAVNTPQFMKSGILSWAMQFRKYALGQTQLYADMYARIMHGATAKEKRIAAKQLGNLMLMQVLVGGAMGLPGLELIKIGVTLLAMLGLSDDDYETWQNDAISLLGEVTGKDWATLISSGVITRAIGIDVSTRMSQADLWTGFFPDKFDKKGLLQYAGGIFLGAPGQTVVDWVTAAQDLKAGGPDNTVKALEKLIPIKTLADTVKGIKNIDGENYTPVDAAIQAFGFKSAKQANSDAADNEKRIGKQNYKEEADKLRASYRAATTNGEKARIKGLIRDYNRRKKPEGVTNIDLNALLKPKKETP